MRILKPFFLVTDIGFLLYWTITFFHLIPESYLFKDYSDPLVVAWNWSFLPLDLLISITGLSSLALLSGRKETGKWVAAASLLLTFCSGLQAIAFWTYRRDFDWAWWIPNLYLLLYPIALTALLVRKGFFTLETGSSRDVST